MKKLLISLADFPAYVPFSVNTGAHLVDPHIRRAQVEDVGPLLSKAQWDALDLALEAVAPEFAPEEFDSAEFFEEAAESGWENPALASLWYGGIRPLLVTEAARRMLLWHGLHITPNGAETVSDVGHMPISNAQRTELRSDLAASATFYRARFEIARRAAFPLAAATCCGTPTRRRPTRGGFQSSAV
ncbi:MAG: hypothetical protein ACRYFR_04915 [Janthinobacterium lividum]